MFILYFFSISHVTLYSGICTEGTCVAVCPLGVHFIVVPCYWEPVLMGV